MLNFNQSLTNLYKKYYNLFNNRVSKFVNSDVLEQKINQQFEQNVSTVKHDNAYKTTNHWITNKWGTWCVKMSLKKIYIYIYIYIDSQVEDAIKNKKIKTMIDFDNDCNSIKSIIVSGNTTVDVSTRFIKGKMLMFAKVSLKSFVYDIIDVFSFPD